MNNPKKNPSTRQQVKQWLSARTNWELKSILTIHNPNSQKRMSQIVHLQGTHQDKCRYSYVILTGTVNLYTKGKHRYQCGKDLKQQKFNAASKMQQALVVNRHDQSLFSIRDRNLRQILSWMEVLSGNNSFTYFAERKSLWFQEQEYHSFAEWLAYLFEIQIMEAYQGEKKYNGFNESYFWSKEFLNLEGKVLQALKKNLYNHCKQNSGDNQDQRNIQLDTEYQFGQCLDRIRDNRFQPYEAFIEYVWLSSSTKDDCLYYKTMQKTSEDIYELYENGVFDNEIVELERLDKGSAKKKKKKGKKNKENGQDLVKRETVCEKIPSLPNLISVPVKIQEKIETISEKDSDAPFPDSETTKSENCKLMRKKKQPSQNSNSEIGEQKNQEKLSQRLAKIYLQKTTVESDLSQSKLLEEEQMDQNFSFSETKVVQNKKERQMKEKISEHIKSFTDLLKQDSKTYDVYREAVVKTVQQTFQEMQFKSQWKLQVYGSCATDFTLKESDVDLLLLIKEQDIRLEDIHQFFKVKKWVVGCDLVPASVPIITFCVNLKLFPGELLNQRQLKKSPILRVDLSFSKTNEKHTGLENTKYNKQLFEKYESLKVPCYFLKELLRERKLNKPFSGGINSSVLITMVFGILKMKGSLNSCCYDQLIEIANFMNSEFKPCRTVIMVRNGKKNDLKADPTKDLNIENPIEKGLVKTSAYKIGIIAYHLKKMKKALQMIFEEANFIGLGERKKMKKMILTSIQQFLQENSEKIEYYQEM